jgi:putative glutamine amidotransferase
MKRSVIGVTCISSSNSKGNAIYPHPEPYCQAVHDNGGLPVTIPAFLTEEESLRYLEHVDGMIFIGGPDIPPHFYGEEPHETVVPLNESIARSHLSLVKSVLESDFPFLGVCLGCQELCVGAKGKLIQHIGEVTPRHRNSYVDTEKGKRPDTYHFVEVEQGTLLEELFGSRRIRVNSCHHQAVNPDFAGEKFKIAAYSTEDGIVESIERQDREFGLGVQWHPERIDDEDHRRRIFGALIAHAAKHRIG